MTYLSKNQYYALLIIVFAISIATPLSTAFAEILPRPVPIGFIVTALFASYFLFRGGPLPFKTFSLFLTLAFFASISCYLALFHTEIPVITFFLFLQIFLPFAGYVVAYNLLAEERHIKLFCMVVAIIIILFPFFIVIENFVVIYLIKEKSILTLRPSDIVTYYQFYQYLPLVFASVFALILYNISAMKQKLAILPFALLITIIMLGFNSYTGLCIMLLVNLFLLLSFFSFRTALYITASCAIIFVLAVLIITQQYGLPEDVMNMILTVNNRTPIWEKAFLKILENPFFGSSLSWRIHEHIWGAHNQLLDIIMRYGLIAGLIWLVILFRIIALTFKVAISERTKESWYQPAALGLTLLFLAGICSLVTTPFQQLYPGTILWALFAVVERKYERLQS